MRKPALSGEFNSLLDQLEQFRDSNLSEVYVPSLSATASFKQLTVSQQSSIITGILSQEAKDNAFSYNRVISNIILENATGGIELSVIDKIPVLLQLRVATVGNHITIDGTACDLNSMSFELSGHEIPLVSEDHSFEHSGITVNYKIPSLQLDADINKDAEKRWDTFKGEEIVTELFKVEISKYIVSVEFDNHTIPFSELAPEQRLDVCEKLPMKHCRHLVEFIEEQKNIETRFGEVWSDDDGWVEVPLDVSLFSSDA